MEPIVRDDYEVSVQQQKIWNVEKELFLELKKVCDKHGLKVFAFGGTLLGAIRHKGFIPWDDDFDVAMLREDYDKLQALGGEFNFPFFLQTGLSDEHQFSGITRLRHCLSTGVARWDYGRNSNNGIYVDIYPLDYIPENKFVLNAYTTHIQIVKSLLHHYVYSDFDEFNSSTAGKIKIFISKFVISIVGYKKYYKHFQKLCGRYRNKHQIRVGTLCSTPKYHGDRWYLEDLKDLDFAQFEGFVIPIPKNFDRCLRLKYHNYMDFPPVDKRGAFHEGIVYFNPDVPYTELNFNPFRKE